MVFKKGQKYTHTCLKGLVNFVKRHKNLEMMFGIVCVNGKQKETKGKEC